MDVVLVVSAVLTLALFAYLFIVLFKGETL